MAGPVKREAKTSAMANGAGPGSSPGKSGFKSCFFIMTFFKGISRKNYKEAHTYTGIKKKFNIFLIWGVNDTNEQKIGT